MPQYSGLKVKAVRSSTFTSTRHGYQCAARRVKLEEYDRDILLDTSRLLLLLLLLLIIIIIIIIVTTIIIMNPLALWCDWWGFNNRPTAFLHS
jgi:hypothetical protein